MFRFLFARDIEPRSGFARDIESRSWSLRYIDSRWIILFMGKEDLQLRSELGYQRGGSIVHQSLYCVGSAEVQF